MASHLELKKLQKIFRHYVLKTLLRKEKITKEMIRMLSGWKHSGFRTGAVGAALSSGLT